MALSDILSTLEQQLDWQRELYKDFHRHPELSMQEDWTSQRVFDELDSLGLAPIRVGTHGIVATLTNGEGVTFLARADFDALPITEETGLDYASENDGVMHACGHDMHTATLLGAVKLLHDHREYWAGTFVALFQPGEETAEGARAMIADGLAETIPTPDAAYSQHIGPGPANLCGFRKGPALSIADSVRVTVFGQGAHGSQPQDAIDPVLLASTIVVRLHTIVSRVVGPNEFSVLTVGSIQSGTKSNVIPDDAQLLINLRHYDEKVRQRVITAMENIVRAECESVGSPREPEFEYYDQFPPTLNNEDLADKLAPTFREAFGDHFIEAPQAQGSEDFSIIPDELGNVPYVYAFVGAIEPEKFATGLKEGRTFAGNHSSRFAPDIDPTIETATTAYVAAAFAVLGKESSAGADRT